MFDKTVIENLLKEKEWTNYRLAKEANLGQSTVHEIMSGKKKSPNAKTLQKLATALDVPVDIFFKNSNTAKEITEYKEKMINFTKNHNESFYAKKIINSLEELNDLGKKEAIKRVEELTYIDTYTNKNLSKKQTYSEEDKEFLMPIACHNDGLTDEEKENMDNIIDDFLKNKK